MQINQDYLFGQREIKMMGLSSMKPIGITVHNTYNSAPAINEAKNQFNNNTKKGSSGVAVHFYVDESNIYQLLPLNIHGWHAGDGTNGKGNRQTIAIEICRSTDYSDDKYKRAEDLTIKLLDKLLKDFNFKINDIYQHENWSGKKCPHRLIEGSPRTWETFIDLIGKGDNEPVKPPVTPPKNNVTAYQRPKGTYQEKGRFTNTCGSNIYMRQYVPNVDGVFNGKLANGDYVDYQDVYVGNGYVWVGNGTTWIPTRELDANGKPKPLNEGWGTYTAQDGNATTKPKAIKVGSKVQIKSNASKYATGQNIPAQYKGKTYTVQQKRSDQSLLKELYSWVYDKDLIVL